MSAACPVSLEIFVELELQLARIMDKALRRYQVGMNRDVGWERRTIRGARR